MVGSHPFDRILGPRRPLGIGATPTEFRASHLKKPDDNVLNRYSANPRNASGDWYEDYVDGLLTPLCANLGIRKAAKFDRRIRGSRVYKTDKVVDIVLKRDGGSNPDREVLGLELKFLGGEGSLVSPKSLIDALDFTSRPYHCLYMIDGEGWLVGGKTAYVDYLAHWWEFTCAAYLERTLRRYFT
jgi:hypothetical protein